MAGAMISSGGSAHLVMSGKHRPEAELAAEAKRVLSAQFAPKLTKEKEHGLQD